MTLSIRLAAALALAASALVSGCDKAGTSEPAPVIAAAPAPPIPEFAPGVTVVAAQHASLAEILGEGFYPKESSGAWTDGARAVVRLPLAQSALGKPLQLDLKLAPYLHPPELTRQSVSVQMAGAVVATFDLAGVETVSVPFTATASPVVFELALPTAASPEDFKPGDDPRKLGVYLISLAVVEPAAPVAEAPETAPPPPAMPEKPATPSAVKPAPVAPAAATPIAPTPAAPTSAAPPAAAQPPQ